MDIVFSVCLGSLALRTNNILCVCGVSDWVRLPRFMQIQMEYRSVIYFSIGTNGTNRQVVNRRPSVVNREFKQITTAGAATAFEVEEICGEYVAVARQNSTLSSAKSVQDYYR